MSFFIKKKVQIIILISLTYFFFNSCKYEINNIEVESVPNILICIADDITWMHMGAYGCNWVKTPNFDKIAKNGLLFTNAYTPNAKCAPSRACLLTGKNSWQLEDAANHMTNFPPKFQTFPEALKEKGYHVGYTGKGYAPGKAKNFDGTERDLLVKAYSSKQAKPPTSEISINDYSANFKDFLSQRKSDKTPFMFWYGGWEPHRKYEYGSGMAEGGKKISDINEIVEYWPDNESVRTDLLDYAFEIEYFDKKLGEILDVLKKENLLDNTLIIVTADNGMPFPRMKSNAYEMSNHVPLAIMWPKGIKDKGIIIDRYTSFIDIAPTILEVANVNLQSTTMKSMSGSSLKKIINADYSNMAKNNFVLFGKERNDVGRPNDVGYPIRGIVKDSFLYVKNYEPSRWPSGNPETGYLGVDGSPTKTEILKTYNTDKNYMWKYNFGKRPSEELYNKISDPYCKENLAGKIEYSQVLSSLKKVLNYKLIEQSDPRMNNNGNVFDEYSIPFPNIKNFYYRYMQGENIKANWANDTDFNFPAK